MMNLDSLILGVGLFILILILVLIIGGIAFFIKIVSPRRKKIPGTSEAVLEILRVRYAKGEITRDEFERMKKDLL
ncbi:MAG: SHOCT domain-containing protein [Syntrophaceae bacterium]|nr:SHOCT domain-containing protein [Syntrophaceae bacterium]